MSDIYYKPFSGGGKEVYFPYTREDLCGRAIFDGYVFDGGAAFFCLDRFGTLDSDVLTEKVMDGSLFEYWIRDGVFDWNSVFKDFRPIDYAEEWEGHIWLCRLYILLMLAQKYCRTGDEKYAVAWLTILKDWYRANPYTLYEDRPSDKVWEDMQVTWRTINIVHSIFFLGNCKSLKEEDWAFVYDLVSLHGRHMIKEGRRHAKDPAPDNHKLQIGTALIMLASLFPERFDSEEFISVASVIVSDNMNNSIFKDGCNNEDSMSYSHFIARLYLEAHLFLTKNGYPDIPGCAETIKDQYSFLYKFSSPKGRTLQIGDSYSMDSVSDIEFINGFYPLDIEKEKKTEIFSHSRMAVLRNDAFSVYVDAMDMTEWHQHYGRPHIIIYAKDMPLLVDSGSINYDRGGLRCRLNSPEGHNVISCDEIPLEDHLTKAEAKEELNFDSFESTGGVQRLTVSNKVTSSDGTFYLWKRTISLYDDKVEINDKVKASKKLRFVSRMHLPDARIGYYSPHSSYQPLSLDNRTVSLRFGSMMETVTSDVPFAVEYAPCVDEENKMNYTQVLLRRHHAKTFEENTVFYFHNVRANGK